MIRVDRRRFLALTGRGALISMSWPLVQGLAGCAGDPDGAASQALSIPLAELPAGQRVRRLLGDVPVEILRTGDRVVARSLLCTHQGCEVAWEADAGCYVCPCHDGTFDADGQVLGGPPTRPLRMLTARVEQQMVIVEY